MLRGVARETDGEYGPDENKAEVHDHLDPGPTPSEVVPFHFNEPLEDWVHNQVELFVFNYTFQRSFGIAIRQTSRNYWLKKIEKVVFFSVSAVKGMKLIKGFFGLKEKQKKLLTKKRSLTKIVKQSKLPIVGL